MIPFNIPYITGNESIYINNAINKLDTTTGESYVNKCITLIMGKLNYNFLGLNSTIIEYVKYGNNVFVGMNSLVLNDSSDVKIFEQPPRPLE